MDWWKTLRNGFELHKSQLELEPFMKRKTIRLRINLTH